MNLFGWRKSLSISEQNPTFKVRYLGNVQTSVMKGEGCADRATNVIWSNHKRNEQAGMEMKIELTGSGMKAYTQDQGLTEYLASRISYCIAHPNFPRLFVWVYRHEGRKNKMELRCHAVLCKSEAKAKAIALQLCDKLKHALEDFKREKLHLQNSRLALQKTNSVPKSGSILPLRTQLLSTAKNFRAPPTRCNTGSKLGAILEDKEVALAECIEEEEEEEEEGYDEKENPLRTQTELKGRILTSTTSVIRGASNCNPQPSHGNSPQRHPSPSSSAGPSSTGLLHRGKEHHGILEALDLGASGASFEEEEEEVGDVYTSVGEDDIIDLEFGNDLNALEQDGGVQYCLHENGVVDSDEESAESGFHDQEANFPDSEATEGGGGGGGGGDAEERKMLRVKIIEKTDNNDETNADEDRVCALPSPDVKEDEEDGSSTTSSSGTAVEVTAL